MVNAKKEFIEHTKGKKIICAKIFYGRYEEKQTFILVNNYTENELNNFIAQLDFEYDNGYGGQNLFGKILFEDSYSDRGEYDGSEWWENHKMPTINDVLNYDPGIY